LLVDIGLKQNQTSERVIMRTTTIALGVAILVALSTNGFGQVPTASQEHEILKKELGTWEATVKSYVGPTGLNDEPQVSTGKETNEMIGEFWLVSRFEGNFGGMPFVGQSMMGYDAGKQKYVGNWIDSFSPNPTKMVGTYDAETKTMTYESTGVGMDGNPMKGKNVVVYEGDDRRVMTMHMAMPGQDSMAKAMEIVYERAKSEK
jgi:hypothetical protein